LRPFCRRLLRTRRPPLVLIRTRKPWVLLRFRLFGWKVRFIAVAPAGDARGPRSGRAASPDKVLSVRKAWARCQTAVLQTSPGDLVTRGVLWYPERA
jgi:hypothetical protein